MPRTKYTRKDMKCPKCDTWTQHNAQRKLQFVATTTQVVNNTQVTTPEFLAAYCLTCGYKLGEFDPADADDVA